jgi:hypothetical protein
MATRKPVIHARDHLPKGADPLHIEYPPGLLAGASSVDLAVRNPGSLLWLYLCGDPAAGGILRDTSGFDSTPRNLTYSNHGTIFGYPYGSTVAGWTPANEMAWQQLDHSALGSGDDGTIKFPYDQPDQNPDQSYPGVLVSGANSLCNWATADPGLQTVGAFLKMPGSAHAVNGHVLGSQSAGSSGHGNGWRIWANNSTRVLTFYGWDGAAGRQIDAPAALIADQWYFLCVTWDGVTYTMHLNGVPVASTPGPTGIPGIGGLSFGGDFYSYAFFDGAYAFWKGSLDVVVGYSKVLSQAEMQAIFAAIGDTGTTLTTVTIGAGDPTNVATPGAVSSGSSPVHQVLASNGAGGTVYEYPTHGVYVGGV